MDDAQLDLVFGALADRTRRAILAQLAETDSNVNDLTALFTMSQPAISKHLKVLEQAGLISRNRQGTMRLSHLEAEPLKAATGWLADYREYWDASYARLDTLLDSLKNKEKS
ncbi:MAG: transcriptional regulator, ArsR family [Aeromicrobium sp.]|nr:transcriptional regulator, ArsR family [Aeromicrobium sp.]